MMTAQVALKMRLGSPACSRASTWLQQVMRCTLQPRHWCCPGGRACMGSHWTAALESSC